MYRIVDEPLDPQALSAAVADCETARGAVVSFLGIVRDRADDGREVLGLSYEAFAPMAVAEFERIGRETRERFGDVFLAITHRIGDVAVGEIAVAVVVGAQHRRAAFAACEYAIDELKQRAPIWKKERYADGSRAWKNNAGG